MWAFLPKDLPIYRLALQHCGLGADGAIWLEYDEVAWKFLRRPEGAFASSKPSSTVALCNSSFVRPDRLISSCFGFAAHQFGMLAATAPFFIEVGGPETGPASHVRGEYQRSHDEAGRPAYVKPDASMRLCLGGIGPSWLSRTCTILQSRNLAAFCSVKVLLATSIHCS